MKQRKRSQIIRDMLLAIHRNGNCISQSKFIMRANLSTNMHKTYTQELLRNKIIAKYLKNQRIHYSLTEKGMRELGRHTLSVSLSTI